MSENLDLVRSIYAGWEHGEYSSGDWAHPDIEYVVADGPDPGSWIGLAAIADVIRDRLKAWEDFRFTAAEYRELAAERVLVLGRARGRGKRSGLELDQIRGERAHVFHVRDGKVTRLVLYTDSDRALADLGLKG
jgi:ketosteroid isomerase-like protein